MKTLLERTGGVCLGRLEGAAGGAVRPPLSLSPLGDRRGARVRGERLITFGRAVVFLRQAKNGGEMFHRTAQGRMPSAEEALPGRPEAAAPPPPHFVHGRPLAPPFPERMESAYFGMGCFWGVERLYWQIPGVYTTAAGYQGGFTPHPTYREVCSGLTGHAESVMIVYDPE